MLFSCTSLKGNVKIEHRPENDHNRYQYLPHHHHPNTPTPTPIPHHNNQQPSPTPRVRWLGYCASIVTTAQRLYVYEYPCQSLPDWWVLTSMATAVDLQWYFSHMFVIMIMCVMFDIECVLGGNILTTTIKFQFFFVSLCHISLGFVEHSTWFHLNCPKHFVL